MLCSELPYFENRPSPIRVLYYEGSLVQSSPSSKIAMFRRFYLPNFARSIRILCYEGSSWWYLNFSGHKLLQCTVIYSVIMKLSAKYFIDVLMIWICPVIITFINHKISLGVTILDPSKHLASGLGSNTYLYLYLYLYLNMQISVFVFVFVFEKPQDEIFVFVFDWRIWVYLKNIFQIHFAL